MKLVILRGLPGSGKSTEARMAFPEPKVICSADDFQPDLRNFDPSRLGECHSECRMMAMNAMNRKCPLVIIDNTNSRKWEYAEYDLMAAVFGYEVEIRTIGGRSEDDVAEYYLRGTKNTPESYIRAMAKRWED